jgi:hypothetical protein
MKPLHVLIVAAWLSICETKNLRGAADRWFDDWKVPAGRTGADILEKGPPAIGHINDEHAMGINGVAAAAAFAALPEPSPIKKCHGPASSCTP